MVGVWSECDYCNSDLSSCSRSLNTLGPARRVAEKPFFIVTGNGHIHTSLTCKFFRNSICLQLSKVNLKIVVYITCTIGTVSDTQQLKDYAVYIANLFFLTSDTAASIVKDIDLATATSGNLLRTWQDF